MSYEVDKEYEVKIDDVSFVESAAKHTPGLEFRLYREPEGVIFHTMWITEGTKARAWETLIAIGVPGAALKTAGFWGEPAAHLQDKNVRITTELDTYKDKPRVRVKWFNALGSTKRATPEAAKVVASLFENFEDDSEPVPF